MYPVAQCLVQLRMTTRSTWDILNAILAVVLILALLQLYQSHKECNSLLERLAVSQQKVKVSKRLKELAARNNLPIKKEEYNGTIEMTGSNTKIKGDLQADGSEVLLEGISDVCQTAFPVLVDSLMGDNQITK